MACLAVRTVRPRFDRPAVSESRGQRAVRCPRLTRLVGGAFPEQFVAAIAKADDTDPYKLRCRILFGCGGVLLGWLVPGVGPCPGRGHEPRSRDGLGLALR